MNIFKRIYNEINNYFFIRKVIKKHETTVEWKVFKLRRDWVFRIYTVVNLDEDFIKQVSSLEITQAVLDHAKPIFEYLKRLDFHEIVTPEFKRIPNTNSWLVIFTPLFKVLSLRNILISLSLIVISILCYNYRLAIEHLIHYLRTIF